MRFDRHVLKKTAVYLVATGCLVWVLRGVRLDDLVRDMRGLRLWWIAVALILDVVATVCHGLRWRLLLRPLGRVSLWRSLQAVYAGLFTNELLPMRAGELVRGYLMSRWIDRAFAVVLPSMITERFFDGMVLILGLGFAGPFVSLPDGIEVTSLIIAMVALFTLVAVGALALKDRSVVIQSGAVDGWRRMATGTLEFVSRVFDGIRIVWTSKYLPPAVGLTVLYLSVQVLSFWMVMAGYGLHLSPWAPVVVLIFVRLGTAVPNAPANIGPYQFFCVVGLTLFGVDKTSAAGFAVVMWAAFGIPIWIIGFLAFAKSGLSLASVRRGRVETV